MSLAGLDWIADEFDELSRRLHELGYSGRERDVLKGDDASIPSWVLQDHIVSYSLGMIRGYATAQELTSLDVAEHVEAAGGWGSADNGEGTS